MRTKGVSAAVLLRWQAHGVPAALASARRGGGRRRQLPTPVTFL
jgi:hypothetical protein